MPRALKWMGDLVNVKDRVFRHRCIHNHRERYIYICLLFYIYMVLGSPRSHHYSLFNSGASSWVDSFGYVPSAVCPVVCHVYTLVFILQELLVLSIVGGMMHK